MTQDPVSNTVFEIDEVAKTFGNNGIRTYGVRNATLEASKGEFVLLMGPSGSGKTTLLMLIAGLISADNGSVRLFGNHLSRYTQKELQALRAKRIGFIFQNFLLIDSLTVLENLTLVMHFCGINGARARSRGLELLESLDIERHAQKYPVQLSHGEKQRVAVARAIANNPGLIIADEPTASLESRQGFEIISLLNEYKKEQHACIIAASHDIRIKEYADRVVWMEDGKIENSHR